MKKYKKEESEDKKTEEEEEEEDDDVRSIYLRTSNVKSFKSSYSHEELKIIP